MNSVEGSEVPVLCGEEAIRALHSFIDELEQRKGIEFTDKQTVTLTKLAKGLISSIHNEAASSSAGKNVKSMRLVRALINSPSASSKACSCSKCGKSFSEPIELTVRVEGSFETYYACPYCFSKVRENEEGRSPALPRKMTQATAQEIEAQVEQVTLEVLRDVDMLSDTEGRYIFHLASTFLDS